MESIPSSPSQRALVVVSDNFDRLSEDGTGISGSNSEWRPVYQGSNNAVVLYNPTSHAIAVHDRRNELQVTPEQLCPYCSQSLPADFPPVPFPSPSAAPNYFELLAAAPSSVASETGDGDEERPQQGMSPGSVSEGYFSTFFKEEYRLGMGASGSVYLCQHVLNGNPLGHFAVKKIAVGDNAEYLSNLLKEVRLLESLHHPNVINYHHAWLETCQFSSFGPAIPTLHILMQFAEGGSLDDFIDGRLGKPAHNPLYSDNTPMDSEEDFRSRSDRIRTFKKKREMHSTERNELRKRRAERGRGQTAAIHLFSAEEIKSLFGDIVCGLGFLHSKSVLHLDLKPLNVLLTWDEGSLIPRAMLSDFGTSQDMLGPSRVRSGNTGTLEYSAPEAIYRDPSGQLHPIDSRADMWSLGMILYKMVFFSLPFKHAQDNEIEELEREILQYPGFKGTPDILASLRRRSLPRALVLLLESLLHTSPFNRPTCEQVLKAVKEGKLDPVPRESASETQLVVQKRHSPPPGSLSSSSEGSYHTLPGDESHRQLRIESPESLPSPSITEAGQPEEQDLTPRRLNSSSSQDTPTATQLPVGTYKSALEASFPFSDPQTPAGATASRLARFKIIKFLKSGLAVAKIFSLFRVCAPSPPTPLTLLAGTGMAIWDMWYEDDWLTLLYFGAAHIFLLSRSEEQICIG